jgi:hypothetical protein
MWKRLRVKYPLFLSDFNETWIFSTDFRKKKKPKHQISSKSVQSGVELFHADRLTDGRTDRQTDGHGEDNSHFSQFCERKPETGWQVTDARAPILCVFTRMLSFDIDVSACVLWHWGSVNTLVNVTKERAWPTRWRQYNLSYIYRHTSIFAK